jgi:hypothetical protein
MPSPATAAAVRLAAMTTHERELTAGPIDECLADGRLNPAARGWSRRPVLRSNLRGPWGRVKRWEYWSVIGGGKTVAITYADVDYLGIVGLWCCDLESGFEVERSIALPGAPGIALGDRVDHGTYRWDRLGLVVEIDERPDRTTLRGRFSDRRHGEVVVEIDVARPDGHETMNVLIPWSERRFQFTSKQTARPATGTAWIGDRTWTFGPDGDAFGTLDHGRGLWPYSTRWNWAAASGTLAAGPVVGLQFGGKWTDGTGFTENALCVDGRLSKIGEELRWDYSWDDPMRPWRVTAPVSGAVDLTMSPIHDRHRATKALVLSTEVHQVFGHWAGTIRPDGGDPIEIRPEDRLLGFAEESRSRW